MIPSSIRALTGAEARRGFAPLLLLTGLLLAATACSPTDAAARADDEAPPATAGHSNVIVHREDADRLWVFAESPDELGSGGEFHIYLDPETHPEAPAAFAEFGLGPGGALPPHKHEKTVEISYFLDGEGVVQVFDGGEPREVPVHAGDVWYIPVDTWHGLRNTGATPLKLVFASIPNEKKGLLSFFRRIGAEPGETPAAALSPEEFARIAAEHDLVLRPATVE